MLPDATQPALLIFTLGPARERLRRRLLPARLGSWELALHRKGLETAMAAGRETGCRLVISSPGGAETGSSVGGGSGLESELEQIPQRGRTFAERLRRSLATLDRRWPAAPRVIVGTDVPGLAPHHVGAALRRLEDDPRRVVVGPSPDGGIYLLASRQPLEPLLETVRWQRRDTLRSLLAALAAAGLPVALLPALADLDRRSDLERWLVRGRGVARLWHRLRATLRQLLAILRRPLAPLNLGRTQPAIAQLPTGRGPPA